MKTAKKNLWVIAGFGCLGLLLGFATAWAQASDPDLNNDGVVNILDISLVGSCLGVNLSTNPQCQAADTDGDGDVDMDDLNFVVGSFGQSGFPSIVVPEPMTVGSEGGTFTNPNDETSVTAPPGAFTDDQPGDLSVVSVSLDDIRAIAAQLGIELPEGFELMAGLQVGPTGPNPQLALTASLPMPTGVDSQRNTDPHAD